MNKHQLEQEIHETEDYLRHLLEQYQELSNTPEEPDLEIADPLEFIHVLHAQAFDDSRRRR